MASSIKVAVLGVGSLGQNHARIYKDLHQKGEIELIGVFDTNHEQAKSIAAKYGTIALNSLEEAASADALSIVTPTITHHQLAKSLLEKGKHLLIEKPMTDNVHERQLPILPCSRGVGGVAASAASRHVGGLGDRLRVTRCECEV